jgi:hypothetical protein
VIVTTFAVPFVPGIVPGAVYSPPEVMEPKLPPVTVPVTVQFTSVLLRFKTFAVHWEVASNVTLDGVHEMVIVGVTVVEVELPQELRIASAAVSPNKNKRRSQRRPPRPNRKFGSNTRNPPARSTMIFLRKIRSLCTGGPQAGPASAHLQRIWSQAV